MQVMINGMRMPKEEWGLDIVELHAWVDLEAERVDACNSTSMPFDVAGINGAVDWVTTGQCGATVKPPSIETGVYEPLQRWPGLVEALKRFAWLRPLGVTVPGPDDEQALKSYSVRVAWGRLEQELDRVLDEVDDWLLDLEERFKGRSADELLYSTTIEDIVYAGFSGGAALETAAARLGRRYPELVWRLEKFVEARKNDAPSRADYENLVDVIYHLPTSD